MKCRGFENRSVSRILSTARPRGGARMGDHSSRPYVAGRLKRPTRRRGALPFESARSDGPPFARLPIWSCTARSLPGRACHQARRCALTLSPEGPHRFTHHPLRGPEGSRPLAGLFSVALVVARPFRNCSRSPSPPCAQPLAGSLPFGVRTFLPRTLSRAAATARPALNARRADYSKPPLNTYRGELTRLLSPVDIHLHLLRLAVADT